MNELMETLLNILDTPRPEAETQAQKNTKEAIRAAEQHLTFNEFDALWNTINDILRGDDVKCFTLGFRLGVQLTLEGLRPIIPK